MREDQVSSGPRVDTGTSGTQSTPNMTAPSEKVVGAVVVRKLSTEVAPKLHELAADQAIRLAGMTLPVGVALAEVRASRPPEVAVGASRSVLGSPAVVVAIVAVGD